ncbi:PLP-dependent aminotransferase family protein [Staphylococcus pasteuri]|uniref:aminotransferase-like domain-containing protein n=1 Tax=Staphylococcus pasteuri TaxID=45972 RepID=UPI001E5BC415|nr:PLP-dependent aminotransferase family protein [Staphylococcus pasteuri]MCE3022777.1 PLP-dependent aminotransferase family protein [Staphylococcus pasteuri]
MKYKEIASYIREKIVNGDWFCGMKLPTHRDLANQFNVNRVTIIKSIESLESEGFIYTKQGSGTYVSDYLDDAYMRNKWADMMEWSFQTRSQYIVQLINKLKTNSTYIHISKGELGQDLIPHNFLKMAIEKVSDYIGDLSFGYHNGYGYEKLRDIIAERCSQDGINVDKSNVMITSGALHAIQLLATGFLSQNTMIFHSTPSYIDSTNVFEYLHMTKVKLPYDNMQQFQELINQYPSNKEKAIYIEPTFNNPTGQSLTLNIRRQIINYSRMHNIPIIEDDIYRDIWFEKKPLKSMKSFDTNGKVVYVSSFSKSVAPALRIGWIIAPELVIEQLADIRMQIDYGSSILSQMVIYEMLAEGDYDQHTRNIREQLRLKRDDMLSVLEQHFSKIATWNIPNGGFFIWLIFHNDINVKRLFIELASKEHILINPGFIYVSDENAIRLSFAYESKENIEYALKKIREYVDGI